MTVAQPDGPINHVSHQHCVGEVQFFLTPRMGVNSIKGGLTWKSVHVDNVRNSINTLVSNFAFLKRIRLYIVPFTAVPFIVALTCFKVTDSLT